MPNYQGLNCIMPEITMMLSNAAPPHDQHIYDYFNAMEKFVRTTVPQLFADCMAQFQEQLIVEIKTYLNGEKINHSDIQKSIAKTIQKAIDGNKEKIKISIS